VLEIHRRMKKRIGHLLRVADGDDCTNNSDKAGALWSLLTSTGSCMHAGSTFSSILPVSTRSHTSQSLLYPSFVSQ